MYQNNKGARHKVQSLRIKEERERERETQRERETLDMAICTFFAGPGLDSPKINLGNEAAKVLTSLPHLIRNCFFVPVVPHKAVRKFQHRNLQERSVVMSHGWQIEADRAH